MALRKSGLSATSVRLQVPHLLAMELAETSDEGLVARAISGDASAFMELVRIHDRCARTVAYAVTMNRDLMDDVLQESYLKAFRSLKRYKPGTSFRAWLLCIVKNTAIDEIRKQRKVIGIDGDALERQIAPTPSVDESVVNTVSVKHALAQLPEQQRIAIRLIDAEQLSYAEVATVLGLPVGTVSSRVNVARVSLRNLLISINPKDQQR